VKPRTRLEIADSVTLAGMAFGAVFAVTHLHGWQVWAVWVGYFVAVFAKAYVYFLAKAKVHADAQPAPRPSSDLFRGDPS
jgi:O-antigen/teichoic acid export membrane protein